METVDTVVWTLWVMLPAYVPNNAAVLAGGNRPIDGGRRWGGRRVLGDGKTWRGTLVGTIVGTLLALGLTQITPSVSAALGTSLPLFPARAGLGLAFGAMLGDIGASFLKRWTGRERGAAFPGLDQLDFAVGALFCAFVVAPAWFTETFTLPVLVVVVVATPVLHVVANGIAYFSGLKNEPW